MIKTTLCYLLTMLIVISNVTFAGALRPENHQAASAPDIPPTCIVKETGVNLEDCGATVFRPANPTSPGSDPTAADDDALDAAISVVNQNRGGTINFPIGEIKLTRGHQFATPTFSKYSYTLQGFSGSRVRLNAAGHNIFHFEQAKLVVVDSLTILGTPADFFDPEFIDAEKVFDFGADIAKVTNLMVANVAVTQAIIDTADADVTVEDYIGGGNSSELAHFITSGAQFAKSLTIRNARIFDYELIDEQEFYNKSSARYQTWIYYDTLQANPRVNANAPRTLTIDGARFDEAGFNAIIAKNLHGARLHDIYVNIGSAPDAHSIILDNVRNAIIENCQIGYGGGDNNAIEARNNTKAYVTGLVLGAGVKHVADDATSIINLRNCFSEQGAYNQCTIRNTSSLSLVERELEKALKGLPKRQIRETQKPASPLRKQTGAPTKTRSNR